MKSRKSNERVYFHYEQLEEFRAGMWRIVRGDAAAKYIELAADLMRDTGRFKEAMREALENWPNSCAHNLTAEDTNRLAWLGHAGCCLAVQSSEENTRRGWHTLTPGEQDRANQAAQEVLNEWIAVKGADRQLELLANA